MQTTPTNTLPPSAACCAAPPSARRSGGRALLAAALAASGLGAAGALAAGGWSWLVAAGVAPALLAALPCLMMCGLGLCLGRMGSERAANGAGNAPSSAVPPTGTAAAVPRRREESAA